MGNSQYCCNYKEKDLHDKDYSEPLTIDKGPAYHEKVRLKKLIDKTRRHETKIIKLQALFRGFMQRKVYRLAHDYIEPKP